MGALHIGGLIATCAVAGVIGADIAKNRNAESDTNLKEAEISRNDRKEDESTQQKEDTDVQISKKYR